jgi:hypothetical protein
MPHGIEAIKTHLETVDNVPLLVSLFTDATPLSVKQMVEVFREHGEVVLAVGGGYRSYNQSIYSTAHLGCSVSVLPGLGSATNLLPADEEVLVRQFPVHSSRSLSRADILLSFRLIGLNTINFLQTPYRSDLNTAHRMQPNGPVPKSPAESGNDGAARGPTGDTEEAANLLDQPLLSPPPVEAAEHLRLAVLMEALRMGRIFLLNLMQALAFYCVATVRCFCIFALYHASRRLVNVHFWMWCRSCRSGCGRWLRSPFHSVCPHRRRRVWLCCSSACTCG